MHTILISEYPMVAESWKRFDVESVNDFFMEHFPIWPETARVYKGDISQDNDVTPHDHDSAVALERIQEPLWVAVYPGTGTEVLIALTIVSLIASVSAILLIPDVPNINTARDRDARTGSPNNRLSGRTNKPRPDARIPDIYGTVKSIPDLIQVPYTTWDNNRESETTLMCVGVGDHNTPVGNIKDGDTPVEQIPNISVHVYSPGQAPTGAGPFSGDKLALGPPIVDSALNVFPVSSFNGQEMVPFNANTFYGTLRRSDTNGANTLPYPFFGDNFETIKIQFTSATSGVVYVPYGKSPEFVTNKVSVGDRLFLSIFLASMPASSATTPDLNSADGGGTEPDEDWPDSMVVTFISSPFSTADGDYIPILVFIPTALQSEWALMPAYTAGLTPVANQGDPAISNSFAANFVQLTTVEQIFAGPFLFDNEDPPPLSINTQIIANFVALKGLTLDDGKNLIALTVTLQVRITPSDSSGTPTAPSIFQNIDIVGSEISPTSQRGVTMRFDISSFSGSFLISARRITNRKRTQELSGDNIVENFGGERAYVGRITDEVRCTHIYVASEPLQSSFGNVTLVHTVIGATEGRTSQKPRELSMTVSRLINTWNGSAFVGPEVQNAQAENVLFSIMKDSFIGNRSDDQIDFEQIADEIQAVRDYFGLAASNEATDVSYTFDDYGTSFEESVQLISNLAFCQAYRQADQLRVKSEVGTDLSSYVFNHRNILPESQKITHTFGPATENDSAEVDYVDPFNGRTFTVTVPTQTSVTLVSPANVRVPGISSRRMAYVHAWRAFQKLIFQRQALEMQTTQEAGELIVKERVLIADTTQLDQQSGHITEVSGLSIKTSQPPTFAGGVNYTIFLQQSDRTLEAIVATAGTGGFDITLGTAPSLPLRTDPALGVPTLYNLIADDEAMPTSYLVSNNAPQSNMVFDVSAINYSDMYYFADSLETWFPIGSKDKSPRELIVLVTGGVSTVVDPTRGTMISLDGTGLITADTIENQDLFDVNGDWTYAVWARPDVNTSGFFVDTTAGSVEVFMGLSGGNLVAGTNTVAHVAFGVATTVLHHFSVTYTQKDGLTQMKLFVDGLKVAQNDLASVPTLPQGLRYFSGYDGAASELQYYRRALSEQAILELFRTTQI